MKNGPSPVLSSLPGPVLVTGHTGFKGAWLTILLEHLGIPAIGYSLKPDRGSLFERGGFANRIPEIFADIRDSDKLRSFIALHKPSCIIHMAAQPLVLESYKNPVETFDVNVMGTANLLEISFKYEFIKCIVVVTTDKVYRNENTGHKFIETDPLGGKDPYSSSKVATENVVSAWQQISSMQTGPKVISVRAGNVIGGGDFAKNRIIPDLVRSILINKENIVIRNPYNTRPWQHVLDPLAGYLRALESGLLGNNELSYNFAPDCENLSVREVAEKFITLSGYDLKLIIDNSDKSLEASYLNLDATKAKKELNWKCLWTQPESINRSFDWWQKLLDYKANAIELCKNEISIFVENSKFLDVAKNA